jgi:ATP-binding cassette subfamily B protein
MVIYFGGSRVIDGEISIGTLTAFFGYLALLIWPMIAFGWITNVLQQGAASMARLAKIFDTQPTIRDTEETDTTITELRGEIEFRNVSLTHHNTAAPTLRNITLKIERGATVAIVGHTGSGKTSLVNLIPRLYDATEGSVLIDGVDVRKIPLAVLRRHVGMVPQETFLFSDTLAENIRYGVAGDDGAVLESAAEIAQLTKDVREFPKQFETMIGERGITLSGGQKQRTSIARALMRRPTILLLDDALSSVDTETEEEMLKRLKEFMKDRTSIIISHRISTVKDADLIVVLHNGEIVERGTHEDLAARGGIYADLHEKQLLERELEEM